MQSLPWVRIEEHEAVRQRAEAAEAIRDHALRENAKYRRDRLCLAISNVGLIAAASWMYGRFVS